MCQIDQQGATNGASQPIKVTVLGRMPRRFKKARSGNNTSGTKPHFIGK